MRQLFYSSLGISITAAALGVFTTALFGCGSDISEENKSTMAASTSGGSLSSSSSGTMAGTGGAGGVNNAGGAGGGNAQGGMGGGARAMAMPDFKLLDTNQNSLSYQQEIAVSQSLGKVSAWYFGHST